MGWNDDRWAEEAEREMEQARANDSSRTGAKAMGQLLPMRGRARGVPPQVVESGQLLTCFSCGFSSSTHRGWTVDPMAQFNGGRARGLVCAGRCDETGARIDCFDKLDREAADIRGREVHETRLRIRAERERARSMGPRGGRGYEP